MSRAKMVTLRLDAELYAKASKTLKARGTDIDTWIKLQLKAFSGANVGLLKLNDKMPGGKYIGECVEDVIRVDLSYAKWMMKQDWATKYDTDVHELVNELGSV